MIKAILFDMDGILYDSEKFYLDGNYEQLCELGYTGSKEALIAGVGRTVNGLYELYYDLLDHKVPISEIKRTNDLYYENHPLDYKKIMFDGIQEMTKKLHEEGSKLACCSSSPLWVIEDSLKEMEIRNYFDYVQSGEELEHAKPYPDIYLEASRSLQVDKDECIVYEDSDIGIEAGKRAGMFVVARKDDRFNQTQEKADLIVDSVYELVSYIERKNAAYGRSNQN